MTGWLKIVTRKWRGIFDVLPLCLPGGREKSHSNISQSLIRPSIETETSRTKANISPFKPNIWVSIMLIFRWDIHIVPSFSAFCCKRVIVLLWTCRIKNVFTVMRSLTTGILSGKCVVKRFCHRANIIECTYTNLDTIACYTPRLYGIAYCS